MNKSISPERYLLLFIPWIIASLLADHPVASYLIAWLGSFFIFYASLKGWVRALPDDIPVEQQLLRPIFLTQVIFAAYMCCTSIFYFIDTLGYIDFKKVSNFYLVDQKRLLLTAQCQRYYCLGHAAFTSGMLITMQYPIRRKYTCNAKKLSVLVFNIALASFVAALGFRFFPALAQFVHHFDSLTFIAATLSLAMSITERNIFRMIASMLMYGFNLYGALLSGFKEPIILSILILGIFLYPSYRRTVALIFIPAMVVLFLVLPTYNRVFRQQAWFGTHSTVQASKMALNSILQHADQESNWPFFAYRLSEIDMFTKYLSSTPSTVDFYGTQLLTQAMTAIIPRILWPSKPITEDQVMERVYAAGVVSKSSTVSAKPAFIVDSYLSGGVPGIFIFLFGYGVICQFIANKAEQLFDGYLLGISVFFTGLFQVFWRGQSFEFLLNAIIWSYVTMYLIFKFLLHINILKRIENTADQRIL